MQGRHLGFPASPHSESEQGGSGAAAATWAALTGTDAVAALPLCRWDVCSLAGSPHGSLRGGPSLHLHRRDTLAGKGEGTYPW